MFQQQLGISNFKGGIQILKKEFRRYLKDNVLIQKLKNEKLFTEKLLPDIQKQAVFPAIRENGIYFYYYNSLLFEYDGKFKTHPKFAFVPSMYGNSYVSDGNEVGKISNFYDGYENIKERAKLYASPEAIGVYNICKSGNILSNNNYVVLDIEVAFETEMDKQNGIRQNRIDILLYDIKEKALLFNEAKHFTNGEIWSNSVPAVVNQVNRYNNEIAQRKDEILNVYKKYIGNINKIFADELDNPLPLPQKVNQQCGLVIFGFDSDQRNGRLENVKQNLINNNIKLYCIGNERKINLENLYNKSRQSGR